MELKHVFHDVVLGNLVTPAFHGAMAVVVVRRHREPGHVGGAVEVVLLEAGTLVTRLREAGSDDEWNVVIGEALLVPAQDSAVRGADSRVQHLAEDGVEIQYFC